MVALVAFVVVFVAGLITALATGVGALPFVLVDDISDAWNVVLWGIASGIMLSASVVGLIAEGLAQGSPLSVAVGMGVGVALVVVSHAIIEDREVDPGVYEAADFRKLVLILGILTVHSFPEGVAIGVSFADLDLGATAAGLVIPPLAIIMTVAISIHNVPEGTAISIPLRTLGVPPRRMVLWSVFSSLPQPIGAVLAFGFVRIARPLLPYGYGFAAGAMIYLVLTEFLPEALEQGVDLPRRGRRHLLAGLVAGAAVMAPLTLVLG